MTELVTSEKAELTTAEKVDVIYDAVIEIRALLEHAEPLLETFFGKPGEPAKPGNPMLAIMGSMFGAR